MAAGAGGGLTVMRQRSRTSEWKRVSGSGIRRGEGKNRWSCSGAAGSGSVRHGSDGSHGNCRIIALTPQPTTTIVFTIDEAHISALPIRHFPDRSGKSGPNAPRALAHRTQSVTDLTDYTKPPDRCTLPVSRKKRYFIFIDLHLSAQISPVPSGSFSQDSKNQVRTLHEPAIQNSTERPGQIRGPQCRPRFPGSFPQGPDIASLTIRRLTILHYSGHTSSSLVPSISTGGLRYSALPNGTPGLPVCHSLERSSSA